MLCRIGHVELQGTSLKVGKMGNLNKKQLILNPNIKSAKSKQHKNCFFCLDLQDSFENPGNPNKECVFLGDRPLYRKPS
jgi:hypothetical protein